MTHEQAVFLWHAVKNRSVFGDTPSNVYHDYEAKHAGEISDAIRNLANEIADGDNRKRLEFAKLVDGPLGGAMIFVGFGEFRYTRSKEMAYAFLWEWAKAIKNI